ncbi:hypothetical protein B0H10DRAFT_2202834 [Mycena sp. CBHHK59/15]|nr:hypothetical protein B0H10DRAFT_2202834 [Mycena sp. CBHHK59/15]
MVTAFFPMLSHSADRYGMECVGCCKMSRFLYPHLMRAREFYTGGFADLKDLACSILTEFSYTYEDLSKNRIGPVAFSLCIDDLDWFTTIEPSADLVDLVRLMNPDFIFCSNSAMGTMDVISSWLNLISSQKIWPLSQDLVNLWGDYRFMFFFDHICWDLHELSNLEPLSEHEDGCFEPLSEQDCLQVLCQVIECPLLARILHACMWGATGGDEFAFSLLDAHVLLDVSWDDMRTAVEAWRPLVSMDLARGVIRVLRAIGTGQRPQQFCRRISLHWGRFIRGSPASPELLRDLWDFVPPSSFFASPDEFHDVEFHDVLQWLKKFPEPPLQLIDRWESYFKAEHSRWEHQSGSWRAAWRDDYELRWREWQEKYQEDI